MKKFCGIIAVFFAGAAGLTYWVAHKDAARSWELYSENLRGPFFTAFLTLGGFLLSLKTFILVRLKEGLYDREGYKRTFERLKSLDSGLGYYGPLHRLGMALSAAVGLCLLTSALQMTVGFIASVCSLSICVAAAATSLALVFFCWAQVWVNLQDWFNYINEEKREELRRNDASSPPPKFGGTSGNASASESDDF